MKDAVWISKFQFLWFFLQIRQICLEENLTVIEDFCSDDKKCILIPHLKDNTYCGSKLQENILGEEEKKKLANKEVVALLMEVKSQPLEEMWKTSQPLI
ncbi:unnamed protein product [Vicia faba]|uniref:Uncharacterized protein n=1 Tax=Vicia faba TaxID=3906 RepID=A0AAV1BBC3_VICFA|nr:unnamed protein product [Vicia faba]